MYPHPIMSGQMFRGGGASAGFDDRRPQRPQTMREWWERSALKAAVADPFAAVGKVRRSEISPRSEEALSGAEGLAALAMTGGFATAGMRPGLGMGGGRLRAYHGSPHSFEKFSTEKIGTGEGAQAYGHGLYFADREATAKIYRDNLSKAKVKFAHPELGDISKDQLDDILLQEASRIAPNMEKRHADMMAVNTVDALTEGDDFNAMRRWVREQGGPPENEAAWNAVLKKAEEFKPQHTKGSMYEVDINADPEHFLRLGQAVSRAERKGEGGVSPVPN